MAIDPSMASDQSNAFERDRRNVRVKPGTGRTDDPADRAVARMVAVARLMDNAWVVPGLGVRVGWDAILGLAPGVGDVAGALAALYIVNEARRMGAPRKTLAMMLANVAIDGVIGAIPAAGDLVDAAFKANLRNLRLMGVTIHQEGHTWDRPAWAKSHI